MGLFDEEKYKNAAEKALNFIKAQMDLNNFTHKILFSREYDASYSGDVMYGTIEGFSGSESMGPTSISCPFYDFNYIGTVGGTCSGVGVNVHLIHDNDYLVMTCPSVDGNWQSQTLYKEIYIVKDYDEEGNEIGTHEEEVEYYLPVQVGEGVKEFRLCTGLTSEWQLIKQTEEMRTMRLVYHSTGEIMPEDGGGAYPILSNYLFRLYTYSDAEYLNDECPIYYADGKYRWHADHVAEGTKIGFVLNGTNILAISGGVSNVDNGRLPASFKVPPDDPQYDKDGSKALWKYGYCLNYRTWAYDIGLALLVFTTSKDYSLCREMMNRLKYEQNSDGSFNFSYDIYVGQLFEGYVRTGAMGWLVWGMCYYTLETGDRSYVGMIEKAGDWMLSRQITDKDDPRYGLMTGGIGAYNMEDYSYVDTNIEWCAVEHQCSGLQALEGCALVLKDSKYKKAAELVRDQLYLKCYDKENGRFYQGINDTAWALDCTTWAGALVFSVVNKETSFACLNTAKQVYLTTGKKIIQSADEEHYNQAYSSDDTFSGFKPYSDKTPDYAGAPDIVWSEGTLGYALLAYILGEYEECKKYIDETIKLQNCKGSNGGILYVTQTYGTLPWEFHVWESVVSSAWLYLLIHCPDVLFPRTLRQVYYMAKINNIHDERP